MRYDRTKDTTKDDVKKEAGEALAETKEALGALGALVKGDGSAEALKKEAGEALEAAGEAAAAAADFVADNAKRFFKTVLGYRLHDPSQNRTIEAHTPTEAECTAWVETQIKAGLVVETDEKGNVLAGSGRSANKNPAAPAGEKSKAE